MAHHAEPIGFLDALVGILLMLLAELIAGRRWTQREKSP